MASHQTEQSIKLLRELELKLLKCSMYLRWIPGLREHFMRRAEAVRDAHRQWSAIETLRDGAGNQLLLLCDNDDFNGMPNNAIIVCADWTEWEDWRFTGETLLEALENGVTKHPST